MTEFCSIRANIIIVIMNILVTVIVIIIIIIIIIIVLIRYCMSWLLKLFFYRVFYVLYLVILKYFNKLKLDLTIADILRSQQEQEQEEMFTKRDLKTATWHAFCSVLLCSPRVDNYLRTNK